MSRKKSLAVKKTPLKVGITGGIGSGKTTVCQIFAQLGIPIYNADERAKHLMVSRQEIIDKVKKYFGKEAYLPDGNLNRGYLASIVFNHPEKLQVLNAIVHPVVLEDGENWFQNLDPALPYGVKEAALLIESGGHRVLDFLLVVSAPEALRLARVVKRDGVAESEVRKRMRNQMAQEEKELLADFVIQNDGDHSLVNQVWTIHRILCDWHSRNGSKK